MILTLTKARVAVGVPWAHIEPVDSATKMKESRIKFFILIIFNEKPTLSSSQAQALLSDRGRPARNERAARKTYFDLGIYYLKECG